MKFYNLLFQSVGNNPLVLYTVESNKNPFEMILLYCSKNNISKIIKDKDFDVTLLPAGSYLHEFEKNKFLQYDIDDVPGWTYKYTQVTKTNRLTICECCVIESQHEQINDGLRFVMDELLKSYNKKQLFVMI